MSNKAIVIGAGIAGIATSIRLAIKGYQVEVFEANSYPGGKLSQIEQDGFRFDAGPSLFTMPQYVDELFELAGQDPSAHFRYQKLAVNCKYFYPDRGFLTAYADERKFQKEVEAFASEHDGLAITKHAAYSKNIYKVTNHVFLERSLHRLRTYLRWDTLKSILKLPQIDSLRSMHAANLGFFNDKRLVQLFDRFATYNGSNPYQAPATLNVIPHLEQHFGAFFPDGGMYSITTSLVKLAELLGVKFKYQTPVQEIIIENKKAVGIQTGAGMVSADLVISNMDVWFTYHQLLKKYPALYPKRILNQQRSSSALIFYWGIKQTFPKLELHNIFFSADYKKEFEAIWKEKTIDDDPTVYVNISSKYKADDAPEGCENWFVMINTPSNCGQNWDQLIIKAKANILAKLSTALNTDISELIVSESILDPRTIQSKTSAYGGALYGNSSNSRFAAFLRHANKSSKIGNLYFCGGSVHPGGGIPLALLSAKIVGQWIPPKQ